MADAKKPAVKSGEKKSESKSTAAKVVDAVKSTAKAVTDAVAHPKEALKHAAQSALDKVAPGVKVGAPGRKVPTIVARGRKRALTGIVRSDKMDKTVIVEVVSLKRDPVYGKYLKDRERYKAHDEKNEFHTGDKVEIREHRALSRDKRWIVSKLIERAKVE
jgi:small subunit ribosomal protein S17